MTFFDDAYDALIGNEGGYANDPRDPGGETMWGVTARVARAHGYQGQMRALPHDTAKDITKAAYWDPIHGDDLPPAVAFQVFDGFFNSGAPAVKWLQRAVGATEDGNLGPVTIAAVRAADPAVVVARFNAYRLQFLAGLSTWGAFGRGWANRIAGNVLLGVA